MIAGVTARLRSVWANLLHRKDVEAALDEELRSYIDLLADEYERGGMTPAAARRAAVVDTGGVEQTKDATRDAWVGNALVSGIRELRYTARSLRRAPTFLVVAVTTLAIGIGGATAVFTIIDASLLRPLPAVPEPERLVSIERVQPTSIVAEFSYADFRDLRDHSTALDGLAAYNGTSMKLEDVAGTDRAWVGYVSEDFFSVLGVRPALGRLFGVGGAGSSDAAMNEVVVLGHALWQRRFAGSPRVIGTTLELDGHAFTIIGVAPPGFIGAMARYPMELWIPVTSGNHVSAPFSGIDLTSRRSGWLRLVGRLAPGKRVEDAQRELAATAAWLAATYPANRDRSVQVFAGAGMTAEERSETSRVPRLLAMAVGLLLLIACANVANLSLVRATARRRELATRLALGASRAVLVRQVALEGAVLAVGAGLLGVGLAQTLIYSAAAARAVGFISHLELRMDPWVLGVALAASALTAVLVSLTPALQVFRLAPGAVLKDGGGALRRRSVGQRSLVALQVGASFVLLSAAAIVFSAFQRVLRGHDEFEPRALTYGMLQVDASVRDTTRQLAFFRTVLARAASDPAVGGVALTSSVPPMPWTSKATIFRRGEEPAPNALAGRETELGLRVNVIFVSDRFFEVMRIPVEHGRAFATSDREGSAPVAIVSRRLADIMWPQREPVDQLLSWPAVEGQPRSALQVVGVAGDTRDVSLTGDPPLTMYVPFSQHPGRNLLLLLRGRTGSPVSLAVMRDLVAAVNPGVAVLGGKTLQDALRNEVEPQRAASAWIGMFGLIALLLAAIGLYGVVAQGVLQRTRELAVRSALGATPGGILRTVLGDGLRVATVGGVVGALGAVAAHRVLRSLFTGVVAADSRAAVVSAVALGVAMLAATYVPARRAARLNPVDALRSD